MLKLPKGKLAHLTDLQRKQELKKIQSPPIPLFKDVRELLLRKCKREKRRELQAIFEKGPFGELERLVAQKLMDEVKALAKEELERENWLRTVARGSNYRPRNRSFKRVWLRRKNFNGRALTVNEARPMPSRNFRGGFKRY